jgi:hypothetical protein
MARQSNVQYLFHKAIDCIPSCLHMWHNFLVTAVSCFNCLPPYYCGSSVAGLLSPVTEPFFIASPLIPLQHCFYHHRLPTALCFRFASLYKLRRTSHRTVSGCILAAPFFKDASTLFSCSANEGLQIAASCDKLLYLPEHAHDIVSSFRLWNHLGAAACRRID